MLTATPSLNDSIKSLITKYPYGIKNNRYAYGYEAPARRLQYDEVKQILGACGNNIAKFDDMISSSECFKNEMLNQAQAILGTYFKKLVARDNFEKKKVKAKEANKKSQEAWKLKKREENAARRAKLNAAKKIERTQMAKKEKLRRKLNLTAEQKKILRLLAL